MTQPTAKVNFMIIAWQQKGKKIKKK